MKMLSLLSFLSFSLIVSSCSQAPTSGLQQQADEHLLDRAEQAQVVLGQQLFMDTRLSEPMGVACASCHDPAQAFTGNNNNLRIPAVAVGSLPDSFGARNSPTAMYAAFSPQFSFQKSDEDDAWFAQGGQFWDGRAADLIEQAKGPFLNSKEMNNKDIAQLIAKIRTASYRDLFAQAFPGQDVLTDDSKAFQAVAEAIAAYEKSPALSPFQSKFDAVLEGKETFSSQEALGFALFKDPEKGNCIACHAGHTESQRPQDWLFTDFTYDNLGVPRNLSIPDNRDQKFFDLGLCQQSGLKAPRELSTQTLCGAFKVPTLRNIAKTAPYMHNGYFSNLKDVVRFYVTRGTNPELWYPKLADGRIDLFNDLPEAYKSNVNQEEAPYDRKPGEQPRLSEDEIDAIVAFLNTLSDR